MCACECMEGIKWYFWVLCNCYGINSSYKSVKHNINNRSHISINVEKININTITYNAIRSNFHSGTCRRKNAFIRLSHTLNYDDELNLNNDVIPHTSPSFPSILSFNPSHFKPFVFRMYWVCSSSSCIFKLWIESIRGSHFAPFDSSIMICQTI